MKILILTFGTRGDVQPFVAVGAELLARGHEVTLAAPERFSALTTEHGLEFAVVDDGPLAQVDASGGVGEAMSGGLRAKLAQLRAMPASMTQVLEDCWRAASDGPGAGADVILYNGQVLASPHIAEKFGVPAVMGQLMPLTVPTSEFAWPGQELPAWLPAQFNRASYQLMKGALAAFAGATDKWRTTTLGLPRRPGRHDPLRTPDGGNAPVLNAISRHVVPPPADWPDTVYTSGYWTLPADGTGLSPELEEFLDAGEPPVLVTFGSMAGSDPGRTTELVAEATARVGVRAVLIAGWGGLDASRIDQSDGRLLAVGQAPYDALLPRTAAVVHHGGAGTIGAAVAGGRPQVVCPFVADQPFWGRRMHELGVAPAPVPQRTLTADGLAWAIDHAVGSGMMSARAAELGELVRAERGKELAAEQLEAIVDGRRPPR